jgi:hypothetical protein
LLIALVDRAADGQRLLPLMARLDRGRADLLVLGHMSRSYLLWTYMGLLIKIKTKLKQLLHLASVPLPAAPAIGQLSRVVVGRVEHMHDAFAKSQ